MSFLLSVDPGVKAVWWALFDGQTLVSNSSLAPSALNTLPDASTVVVEKPRIYPGPQRKGDQNDLIDLAVVVGRVVQVASGLGAVYRVITPRDWKGTLDADAMVERIQERLTVEERARVWLPSAASLHHNVWDSIGIGLHALGRLEPRKVFPR